MKMVHERTVHRCSNLYSYVLSLQVDETQAMSSFWMFYSLYMFTNEIEHKTTGFNGE